MGKRVLSELECFVLGLVWQIGPCSPYTLRRHMQDSPSTQWSGSAGAVYPLVQRLTQQRLLKGKTERTGKRKRIEYSITQAGLTRLRAWIGPPFAPEAVTVVFDPLRTRARFLEVLSISQRQAWVISARETLSAVQAKLDQWHTRYDPSLSNAAQNMKRSAELELKARRQWIDGFRV